jgi:hypothetical protein
MPALVRHVCAVSSSSSAANVPSLLTHSAAVCLPPLPSTNLHRYEGVTRQDVPHGMGVMVFGNGTGGGFHFRDVRVGDT